MKVRIQNAKLVLPEEILTGCSLYMEDGVITAITGAELPCDTVMDAQGLYLAPGFVDIQSHGGGGADFLDGTTDAFLQAAALHARYGTTTIVPTATSGTLEETLSFREKNVLTDYDNFNRVGEQYLQDADVFKNSMLNISSEISQLDASIQQVATGVNDIQTTIGEASIGVTDIAEKTSETVTKASDNYKLSSNTKDNVTTLKQIVDRFEI